MSVEPVRPERALRPAARPAPGSAPATRAYAPAARRSTAPDPSRVLVIGCGALARELVAVIDQAGLDNVDLTCLPATLHNRPGGIPEAVRARIRAARPRYDNIFIAYADCGTGGVLDRVLAEEGVERLPGAHCYEFFSGSPEFAAMMDEEPGTFFLTDFLARNFERLVWVGLGLDRHPELLSVYFGAYKRVVYLAQTDDPALVAASRRAARRLGLAFELRRTGYGDLTTSVVAAALEGVASDARTTRAGRRRSPQTDQSLRGMQQRDRVAASPARTLRGMQKASSPAASRRLLVHAVQEADKTMHRTQQRARSGPDAQSGRLAARP